MTKRTIAIKQPEKKLIILNGPKGCGKTDLTNRLLCELGVCYVDESRCKDRLFELTQQFFSVTPKQFWNIYNDRKLKESPNELFAVDVGCVTELTNKVSSLRHSSFKFVAKDNSVCVHLSIRQAMIYVSEVICKPTFGEDYFGKFRANKVVESHSPIHIDDSCFGTMDEIDPVIEEIGIENVFLVRIFGRGDYKGDSRCYLEDEDIPDGMARVDIENTGTLEEFLGKGVSVVKYWLNVGDVK